MKAKAPVSMCIIVRDDPFLEKCILSFRDYVEELVIVINSNEQSETRKIAEKYADIVEIYLDGNDPETGLIEDFSKIRNKAFDLATKHWVMWVDSDDIIEGADKLPLVLSECDPVKLQLQGIGVLFPYEYAYDSNNKCICRHYRERLFYNRKLFNFVNPVHEVVVPDNNSKTALISREELVFKHHRQYSPKAQEGGRNLRILRAFFEKNKNDARQMYYLGLECANAGLMDEAIQHLSTYVDISGWDDERAMACLKLVDIFRANLKNDEALKWAFRTIEIKENWCEGYFAVGKIFYYLADTNANNSSQNYWSKVVHFIKMGFTMPPTQTLLFLNPTERDYDIHQYYNMALNKLGDIKGALASVETALLSNSTDPNMLLNKKLYENHLTKIEIATSLNKLKDNTDIDQAIVDTTIALLNKQINPSQVVNGPMVVQNANNIFSNIDWNIPNFWDFDSLPLDITDQQLQSSIIMLWKQYMLHDDLNSAITFLENTPEHIKNSDPILHALALTKNCLETGVGLEIKSAEGKLDIIFFAGDGLEIWTPETVKQSGMGGSEIMLLEQAKRLAKLGHKVRVYNSCGNYSSMHDGVEYHPTNRFKNLTCDVLVISRQTQMLADQYNINAKLKLLWVHDVYALNANNELLLKADRILALSEWHKGNLVNGHTLNSEQVIKTRNGIDLSRFNKKVKRDKFKCICSSSPDRYLPALLQMWPSIKARVPQATLSICYGFDNWEKIAPHFPGQMDLINRLKEQIKQLEQLGVIYKGRINSDELAKEMLSSSVLTYPTWFSETFYIGGAEAQAAGLRIITSSIAAINETVGDRGVRIDGDWISPEYQNKFIDETVRALLDDNNLDRERSQQYAKEHFSLDTLAKDWEQMFFNLIEEKKTNPIVPYQPTEIYRK